jgi:hypothetical protein
LAAAEEAAAAMPFETAGAGTPARSRPAAAASVDDERLTALERRLAAVEADLAALRAELGMDSRSE